MSNWLTCAVEKISEMLCTTNPITRNETISNQSRPSSKPPINRALPPKPPTMSDDCPVIAPHRGFKPKARDVLIGSCDVNLPPGFREGMSSKSNSDIDLRRRMNRAKKTPESTSTASTPKSQSPSNSFSDCPVFDTIGEAPVVKRHMRLSDIGKARSCSEFKSDKRLLRTFQEDNILKMPSIDSDIGAPPGPSDIVDLRMCLESGGKSMIYTVSNGNTKSGKK